MKKASTLCLTIPALLVAGTASAATVYDQNGSKLDLYGRLPACITVQTTTS